MISAYAELILSKFNKLNKIIYERCAEIKQGKLPCGCISNHNFDKYDNDTRTLLYATHVQLIHQPV